MILPPPSLGDLRYGTVLRAGLGTTTIIADCDFETYSEAGYQWDPLRLRWGALPFATERGIAAVGAYRYAEHPTTEVLCFAYNLKDGAGRRQWRPGDPFPADLRGHIAEGKLLEAWNVQFEMAIWEAVCVPRLGWPPMPRELWRCAMGKARAFALPGALEAAGQVLGTTARKAADGKRLIRLYSIPRNPTQTDVRHRLSPEPAMYEYNLGDIEVEAEVSSLIPDLPPDELEWWQIDLDINARGVHLDMPSVNGCAAIVESAIDKYNVELSTLTEGAVTAASQIQRLTKWLLDQGTYVESLDREHVSEMLLNPFLRPDCRRALEIRAAIGSASVKKLFSMRNRVCDDGNLRGLFRYHAARTGRTTGADVQPTNLPSGGPSVRQCEECQRHYGARKDRCPWCGADTVLSKSREWSHRAADDALFVARTGVLACFEMFFDDALPTLAGCLRGLFIAKPGHELLCSDYSAIEAVALAELAGETWRQDVFRTHGKIYEASAAKTAGVPLETILRHRAETGEHHPLRKKGKVRELALGYGGWVGALIAFGADAFMTQDEMEADAQAWRDESPAIVDYWGGQSRYDRRVHVRYPELYGIEGAAVQAVQRPGEVFTHRGVAFTVARDVLYCRLISGRYLTYHRPRLGPSNRRPDELTLSFEGWNTNPKNGGVGWVRMDTYGPKLVENIDQATCRDIQRHGLIMQHRAGYRTVLHVYDENVAEVPSGTASVADYERLMADPPPWCSDWPIRAAGGWHGSRYRKD